MSVTVTLPDDMELEVQRNADHLPEIFLLGIREYEATGKHSYSGTSSLLETLASLPTPEEVMNLKASPELQSRIDGLLEKNRNEGLTDEEKEEWERYSYVEHLVRLAKIRAEARLSDGGKLVPDE